MGSMSYFLPQCRFFANSMSGFEENNERGVEFEETEKSRSRSEFGSKLNYSIIPRTTLPSSHIDDHDDDDDICTSAFCKYCKVWQGQLIY